MKRPSIQTPDPDQPITIDSLLAFHDAEFIRHAYQRILGRNPDPNGFSHYLKLLRAGESKIEIIGRLRYSQEGRQCKVAILGLFPVFAWQRIYRLPVLGRILHIISCLYHLPDMERAQRAFEAFTVRTLRNLHGSLDAMARQPNSPAPEPGMTVTTDEQPLTPTARRVLADLRRAMAKRQPCES